MKNFLFITYIFPPQLSPESILIAKFLKYLDYHKWQPTIICADPKTILGPQDNTLLNLMPKSFDIIHAPSPESKFFTKILFRFFPILKQFPDYKSIWYWSACKKVKGITGKQQFDLIFSWSSFMTSSLVGLYAKKITNLPWIAHFSDPWVDNSYFHCNWPIIRFFNLKMERAVMKNADSIIFVSGRTKDLVMKKYPKEFLKKSWVIPHSFDSELYPEPKDEEKNKFVLTHTGGFYGIRTPLPLFEALKLLFSEKPEISQDIECQLVGFLPLKYRKIINKLGLPKIIKPISPVSYLESLKYMKNSSALVLVDAPSLRESVFLPSKLIDYLGAKKPILGITPQRGESADLIKELGVGFVADIQNIEDIKNKIFLMYKNFKENNYNLNFDKDSIIQYEAKNIAKASTDLFDKVIMKNNI